MTTPSPAPSSYLLPSPAGALQAASGTQTSTRETLRALLRLDSTPRYSEEGLRIAFPDKGLAKSIRVVTDLYDNQLIDIHERPYRLGDSKLEVALPKLLSRLSTTGNALLADNEGFLVSSIGYPTERSIHLAALASELVELDVRWQQHLRPKPPPGPPSWWTTGPDDTTRLGFLLLTIGQYPFVLVLESQAKLSNPAFLWLVWALSYRYDRPRPNRHE